jgi:hypothetical protein
LHVPTELRLVLRNRHPSRSAEVTVHVEADPLDGFVLAGMRSGRAPFLLPGAECELRWNLLPIECGFVRLPRVRVVDRRKPFVAGAQAAAPGHNPETDLPGDVVKIVDVRWDTRDAEGGEYVIPRRDPDGLGLEDSEENGAPHVGAVLVLP